MGPAWLPSPPILPGPVKAVCKLEVREDPWLTVEGGRFRKVRQTLEFRHRTSSASLMAQRYRSRPFRRSSRKVALVVVLENHDFWGSGAGGGTVTWFVRELWKVTKSE